MEIRGSTNPSIANVYKRVTARIKPGWDKVGQAARGVKGIACGPCSPFGSQESGVESSSAEEHKKEALLVLLLANLVNGNHSGGQMGTDGTFTPKTEVGDSERPQNPSRPPSIWGRAPTESFEQRWSNYVTEEPMEHTVESSEQNQAEAQESSLAVRDSSATEVGTTDTNTTSELTEEERHVPEPTLPVAASAFKGRKNVAKVTAVTVVLFALIAVGLVASASLGSKASQVVANPDQLAGVVKPFEPVGQAFQKGSSWITNIPFKDALKPVKWLGQAAKDVGRWVATIPYADALKPLKAVEQAAKDVGQWVVDLPYEKILRSVEHAAKEAGQWIADVPYEKGLKPAGLKVVDAGNWVANLPYDKAVNSAKRIINNGMDWIASAISKQ